MLCLDPGFPELDEDLIDEEAEKVMCTNTQFGSILLPEKPMLELYDKWFNL